MSVTDDRSATFGELFRIGEFRVLFGSQLLLTLGESVKMLAFSVIVFEQTNSAGLSAVSWMLGFVPMMLGGLFLASLADRIRPRSLMITGEVTRVAVCLLLAFAGLPVWAMFAVVLVTGVPTAVFMAARNAVLPDILDGDRFVLGRALFTMTGAGAQIAGLAVGGTVIALLGPEGALLVTAVLSLVAVPLIRFGLADRPPRAVKDGTGAVRATLRGNWALLSDGTILGLLLAGWLPLMFMVGSEAVFIPYLTGMGQAGAAGFVLAATAAGMGFGEFIVGRFVTPSKRNRLGLPLVALMGVPLIGFVLEPGPWWAGILAFLAGNGLAYQLVLQRPFVDAVPEHQRGLAFGLQGSGMMTVQGVGGALAGGLAELVDVHHAIAICGGLVIVAGAFLWRPLARPALTTEPPEQ
ncbi:MFS transporter [Herbidospora mongoliensis]|uniref:MFS transporter n=1 Tax=Herbidospora mongoliensis TaxID=688067 RepID=UPI000837681E|nr:MFS transporter [Herbidospora mongoliensis]